ncbi:hypothetical protein BKA61DRAFT_607535 [Leptodontidium sp. MPI-SDFR-AT-0119]|nr:hypothetical protein BKA61DRAFT_607535 [Leptodontidium sp. MPI-SDFR-AT-0119]
MASSTSQNTDVITILLIGLTQAGKSTFVNWLRYIAQSSSDEALEGNGSSSCTKHCGIWEIKILLSDYRLVDNSPRPKEIKLPDKEQDLVNEAGQWTNANSQLVPTEPDARVVTFRIVDTPGLDDSNQNDMNNITEVLGTMNQWLYTDSNPTVNGLVFLIKSTSSFSASFQQLFKYYERCMPDLFGGLTMVNTKFSLKEWKTKRRQLLEDGSIETSQSARSHIVRERRSDFADLLGRDPLHWHVDSKPFPVDRHSQVDNLQVLLSLNTTIDLLRVLAAQKPVKISHMNYAKMPSDLVVDTAVQAFIERKKFTWLKFRELEMAKASAEKKLYIINQERLLELKQKLVDLDTRLARVDHKEEVTIRTDNTPMSDDVSLWTKTSRVFTWGGATKTHEIIEPYEFYEVEFLESARWLKRERNATTKGYTGTYKASWGKFPVLYFRSWTRSSVMHMDDIKKWRREKIETQTSLDGVQEILNSAQKPLDLNEETDLKLVLISQCRDVISKLDLDTIPIEALDEGTRRRYKKDALNINEYDVIDAVQTYQPSLAESWYHL